MKWIINMWKNWGRSRKAAMRLPPFRFWVSDVWWWDEHFYARYVSIKTFYSWKRSGARSIFLKEETQLESSYYFHTLLSSTTNALMSYHIFLKQESYDSTTFFCTCLPSKTNAPVSLPSRRLEPGAVLYVLAFGSQVEKCPLPNLHSQIGISSLLYL